jgi:hypothetical protein
MAYPVNRRKMLTGMISVTAVAAIPAETWAAENKAVLLRDENGTYYLVLPMFLKDLAYEGKCSAQECFMISGSKLVVKKQELSNYRVKHPNQLNEYGVDEGLRKEVFAAIEKRQALGISLENKLASYGFSTGTMNPTKVG